MKVVDANVLIYAVNADTEHHAASRRWLDAALSGADTVAFTWLVLVAFLRITTKVGLFPRPLSTTEAMALVRGWLAAPGRGYWNRRAGTWRNSSVSCTGSVPEEIWSTTHTLQ